MPRYVWLSTSAAGRFEPNGFMMATRTATVKFVPFAVGTDVEVRFVNATPALPVFTPGRRRSDTVTQ